MSSATLMTSFGSQPVVTRPELVRWLACAAVVVMAHAVAALAIAGRSDEAESAAGAPVMVELAALPVGPPVPPRDLAAGPLMETESQERVAEETPPERKEPEKERVAEETKAPDPEVAMEQPRPAPEEKPIEDKPVTQQEEATPVPTAPQAAPAPAARAAAPAVGQTARPTSAVIANWERRLISQLERHKRYPSAARGKVGEVRLEFSLDRAGHLIASRIVRSSGSEALDADALALIKRAAPLPIPPAGLPDDRLLIVVPIGYR